MDSLLERLRAAGPQNRDQRDRRRRARLKEKHEMRLASGEKIPELADLTNGTENGEADSPELLSPPPITLPPVQENEGQSEGEDVADRAAQLLQGLRGDGPGDASGVGSIRVRRRREGNDEERRSRRRRRAADDSTEPSLTVDDSHPTEAANDGLENNETENTQANPGTPVTTISPPTPERGSETRPLSISD